MVKYTLKRVLYMLITLFIIASVTFVLMKFLPGTPYRNQEKLSDEQIHMMNEKYGLNDSIPVQYFNYMTGLVKGDLGVSFQLDNRPVSEILSALIGPSVQLALEAMAFGVIFGILLGVIAAMYQNRWPDYTSTFIAILGKSVPSFVFATVLQYWLGAKLQIFPVAGWGTFADTILPAFALAMFPLATAARFMRTELIDVFASDYVLLAKAKGNIKSKLAMSQTNIETVKSGQSAQTTSIIVPKNLNELPNYIVLRDRASHTTEKLTDDGAIITEKLAKLFDVKPGDTITVKNAENDKFQIKVSAITENYAMHYIYMTKAYYQQVFKEKT